VTPTQRAIDVTGIDLNAIEARRKELGRDLRQRRKAAKMTQAVARRQAHRRAKHDL
jgi:hypothetical protein